MPICVQKFQLVLTKDYFVAIKKLTGAHKVLCCVNKIRISAHKVLICTYKVNFVFLNTK